MRICPPDLLYKNRHGPPRGRGLMEAGWATLRKSKSCLYYWRHHEAPQFLKPDQALRCLLSLIAAADAAGWLHSVSETTSQRPHIFKVPPHICKETWVLSSDIQWGHTCARHMAFRGVIYVQPWTLLTAVNPGCYSAVLPFCLQLIFVWCVKLYGHVSPFYFYFLEIMHIKVSYVNRK